MCMKRIVIIGGGASGLACAIAAAESSRRAGNRAQIVVFEHDDRVGRSILATGNGRCNFSNARIDAALYRNADFVGRVLSSLEREIPVRSDDESGLDVVHRFFRALGLEWREEGEGRQYPLANKASSVLDVLRAAAARLGVQEACERTVSAVEAPREDGGRFTLRMSDGVFERADAVVVACGGKASARLRVADWPAPALRPVLGPLATDTSLIRELNNIRVRVSVRLLRAGDGDISAVRQIAVERGEVMFRKYGVSGIAVFNLSRFAEVGDELSIDFLSEVLRGAALSDEVAADIALVPSVEAAQTRCLGRLDRLCSGLRADAPTLDDFLRGLVLPQVAHVLLKSLGLQGSAPATRDNALSLARALSDFRLRVQGIGDEVNCQVQRGGHDVSRVNPETMCANDAPGLFVAGEALDVDAPCGGFNLHWAWASGLLAGINAVRSLKA